MSQQHNKPSGETAKRGQFGSVLLMAVRRTAYSLIGLAAIVLLIAGGLVLWSRGGLPELDGEAQVSGLTAPVEILRDERGIVTIQAANPTDARFALGYVHAQDRLGQLEMLRRVVEGRLSEAVGRRALSFDKLMLSLDLAGQAERSLPALLPETREALDAYARGINAYLAQHEGPWPPEFYIFGTDPEPWRPAESLMWGKLKALQLSTNWTQEERYARLATALSPEQLQVLFPDLPDESATTLTEVSRTWRENDQAGELPQSWLAALPEEMRNPGASNAWVLSGDKTDSGKPLLASDPHLGLTSPGIWYPVRIETPEGVLAGVSSPGVPFLVMGHNSHIAWGMTTPYTDTQDLVREKIDPDDPNRYLTPSGSEPFETRTVRIPLGGDDFEEVTLRRTRFGPVVSDTSRSSIATRDRLAPSGDEVLSLAWTALQEVDTSADALLLLNQAHNWDDFVAAMARLKAPQQNVFYADVQGNIGFYTPGLSPIREDHDGLTPVEGWTRERIWSGFVPFEKMPHALNPADGLLVNANNRLVGPDYPYQLAAQWPPPHRAERILETLAQEDRHAMESMMALQLDARSSMARELMPYLLDARVEDADAEEALQRLAEWDGTVAADANEPLLFSAWLRQINLALFADELGTVAEDFHHWNARAILRVLREAPAWCDRQDTSAVEDCAAVLGTALGDAIQLIEARGGSSWQELTWGDFHKARFPHQVFRHVPIVGGLLSEELATDGDFYTVSRGTPVFADNGRLFEHVHGASLRAVYDLSDLDNSRFMVAPGVSGHPLSPYRHSLAEAWGDGVYTKLVGPGESPAHRLQLLPLD